MTLYNHLYLHLGMGYTLCEFKRQMLNTEIEMDIFDEDYEDNSFSYRGRMIFNTVVVTWVGHVSHGMLREIENVKKEPAY